MALRKNWSKEEIKILIETYKNPKAGFFPELMKTLGRSRGSVHRKAMRLNLTDRARSGNRVKGLKKPWTRHNSPFKPGKDHIGWRGGRYINQGYVLIHKPNHPGATKRGYIKEHRLVMEKALGRHLGANEAVHHRNGSKSDNRPENLELIKTGKMSHTGRIQCPFCNEEFLIK